MASRLSLRTLRTVEWLGDSGKWIGKDVEGSGPTGTTGLCTECVACLQPSQGAWRRRGTRAPETRLCPGDRLAPLRSAGGVCPAAPPPEQLEGKDPGKYGTEYSLVTRLVTELLACPLSLTQKQVARPWTSNLRTQLPFKQYTPSPFRGDDPMNFHLSVYELFKYTVSSSEHTVSNGRTISKLESISEEVPMVQSGKCLEVLRKTRKVLNKDIRWRTPPECATKALPPESTCAENVWSLVDKSVSEEFASSILKVFEYRLLKNVGKYVQNHTASVEKTVDFIGRRVRASSLPLSLCYRTQPVNAVWENSRCLLWEPYGTHNFTLWAETESVPHRKHITFPLQSPTD
jgi:hypothetical protein